MDPRQYYYSGRTLGEDNTMRYKYVEGLFYYYTNETISIATGLRFVQPTGENAPGFMEAMSDPTNWKEMTKDELELLKTTRSPTIPNVGGTASIVLSPHTIRNWSLYETGTSTNNPGVNMPVYNSLQERAIAEAQGIVSPLRSSIYRVNDLKATFVPLASDVDYSNLLNNDEGKEGIDLKRMGQDIIAKAISEMKMKKPTLPTLRSPQQKANDRNPNIDTKQSVVYGSVIDTFSSSTGGGSSDMITPITYLPSSYDGIYPEIISYSANPNLIWKMTYTDFLGGSDVRIRTNIDSLTINLGSPKPFSVAKTINDIDLIKGQYADRWVSVADETVSYGALTMTVPAAFRNVVSTYNATTEEVDGNQVTKYTITPKNMGFCLLTWDFEFKFL